MLGAGEGRINLRTISILSSVTQVIDGTKQLVTSIVVGRMLLVDTGVSLSWCVSFWCMIHDGGSIRTKLKNLRFLAAPSKRTFQEREKSNGNDHIKPPRGTLNLKTTFALVYYQ
jgi:hypothetical protein